MPLKITYPVLAGFDLKNTRRSYHNGGSWPGQCQEHNVIVRYFHFNGAKEKDACTHISSIDPDCLDQVSSLRKL